MVVTMQNCYEPAYGAMLNERMLEAFGFSFDPWFELNQWDERYESYSIVEGGRMLSNACLYRTGMRLRGVPTTALQVGAVATAKEYRMRGLSRAVFEHILGIYPDAPMFLHANPDAAGFYPKFGFRRVREFVPTIDAHIDYPSARTVRLKLGDPALTRAMAGRGAYSGALDCTNTESVQVFHLLMDYGDCVYSIPELDAVLIASQEADRLMIADVITARPVSFDALSKRLPFTGVKKVEFGFCPDWLGVEPDWTPLSASAHPVFVRGEWELPERFRIPVTSIT